MTDQLTEQLPWRTDAATQLVSAETIFTGETCRIDYGYIISEKPLFGILKHSILQQSGEDVTMDSMEQFYSSEEGLKLFQQALRQALMSDLRFSGLVRMPFVEAHVRYELIGEHMQSFTLLLGSTSAKKQPATKSKQSTTSRKAVAVSDEKVCKAAIAAMFLKSPSIISVTAGSSPHELSYVRAADNSTWKYRCKVEGNEVNWAGWIDGQWGRWRHGKQDAEVTYSLNGSTIEISEQYPGSEASITSYKVSSL